MVADAQITPHTNRTKKRPAWIGSKLAAAAEAPVEIERGGARLVITVDRWRADEPAAAEEPALEAEPGQLSLFETAPEARCRRRFVCRDEGAE